MRLHRFSIVGLGLILLASLGFAGGDHDHSHSQALSATHGGVIGQIGPHSMELVHDARHGVLTLYSPPIESSELKATVTPDDDSGWETPFDVALQPLPFATDEAGHTSRFVATAPALGRIDRFDVSLTLADGSTGTLFAFNGADGAASGYICPMRCSRDRIFPENGNCPVCGMRLKRVEEAHGNHDPRHGGLLFMAPDQWHHLEGVIVDGEFRLYLYNDFVEPLAAAPFVDGATLELAGEDLPFRLDPSGEHLVVTLPTANKEEITPRVKIRFPGRDESNSFDFAFQ